jgi:poly-gamma-glutamate synthesis protein (capsule biosynthesis protein)
MRRDRLILIGADLVLLSLSFIFLYKFFSPPAYPSRIESQKNTQTEATPLVSAVTPVSDEPIGAQYTDASLFLSAIKQATATAATGTVTGLIVPHHLLAKDLAAAAFAYSADNKYRKIVLLSPDHYSAGQTVISTTGRNFSTVFGEVKTDQIISQELKKLPFVGEGDFFYREHGLQAELPFIRYYFPDVEVVALAFQPEVSQTQLDQTVAVLEKTLPPESLIIQSTDFSHYLTPFVAEQRDTETLGVLEQADPAKILSLKQPDNIDSLAAQYVQARLQKDFFHSSFQLLDHKNSQAYAPEAVASTTSYITGAYMENPSAFPVSDTGSAKFILVGDVMLSRYIGTLMEKRNDYDFPFRKIKSYLAGADLVFGNLESPISSGGKLGACLYPFRADPRAAFGLNHAGFKVVSVANNHAFDYGYDAFSDTLANLRAIGVAYAGGGRDFKEAHQGAYEEVNGIRTIFLAYTDLLPKSKAATDNQAGFAYLDLKQMAEDIKAAKAKSDLVIVSFHWGQEYQTKHNDHQAQVAKAAIAAGASLIIGHHPHVVQEVSQEQGVTIAYSLGNFVFDQNFSPDTKTGLALEVTIKNKKITDIKPQTIYFNNFFQPYIAD